MAMLNDRMVYIYIIVYAHVIYIKSSSRKIDTHHCCCNLKHQESIAIPSTYTKIRHVSPGKNWVDVGGNFYSFGVPSLSSLGYPFSRIVHLRCQRPRRFETVGLVGLGLSVLSIPGIQPSIWWKLLRAHFVFWGYHQEISRKFHGIFLAFLFTFFWYFGAAPNWSTTKKKRGWHYGCFQNSKWLHNMAVPSSWSSSWGCHPFHLKKMRLYIMINGLIND